MINADSMQIYDGLQVLTAAPGLDARAAAPHYLYGVADPCDGWSAARWSEAVTTLLATLDGRPAVIVGGTGLYFHALTHGLADMPEIPPAVRARARALAEAGETALRDALAAEDPLSGRGVAPGDRQRLARALEVRWATGRSIEAWREATRPALEANLWRGVVVDADRAVLQRRCAARLEAMAAGGALDEVAEILRRAPPADSPALKALGFREFAAVVRGELGLGEALERAAAATGRYVKRQKTWFRQRAPDWLGADGLDLESSLSRILGTLAH